MDSMTNMTQIAKELIPTCDVPYISEMNKIYTRDISEITQVSQIIQVSKIIQVSQITQVTQINQLS